MPRRRVTSQHRRGQGGLPGQPLGSNTVSPASLGPAAGRAGAGGFLRSSHPAASTSLSPAPSKVTKSLDMETAELGRAWPQQGKLRQGPGRQGPDQSQGPGCQGDPGLAAFSSQQAGPRSPPPDNCNWANGFPSVLGRPARGGRGSSPSGLPSGRWVHWHTGTVPGAVRCRCGTEPLSDGVPGKVREGTGRGSATRPPEASTPCSHSRPL